MSRPFDDIVGSAVIPTAKIVPDPNGLLDELELRLMRCIPAALPISGPMRIGAVLPVGTSSHRAACAETRAWWFEHGLSACGAEVQREILDSMLERSPVTLGWATVPLVAGHLEHLLDFDLILRLVEWVTTREPVDRVVRDAIALSLAAPWLERHSSAEFNAMLVRFSRTDNPPLLRMGLVVAAAYLRDQSRIDIDLQRVVLEVCWRLARRVDAETAMAVGWVLRELLDKEVDRVYPELLVRVEELSRQAMRSAVERLPRELRQRMTTSWMERMARSRSKAISIGPRSVARVIRLPYD